MRQKISVIGGDARQIQVASSLRNCGYDVVLAGFDAAQVFKKDIPLEKDVEKAILRAEIIILPLPVSFEDETLNTPLYTKKILVEDFLQKIGKETLLLTGMISAKVQSMCDAYGIWHEDYFKREELKVLNAIPTAEGAIEIAMREMPVTIHNSHALVIGYGRIGKVLAQCLKAMGARVTVTARKFSDLAAIRSCSFLPMKTENVKEIICQYDMIFNTVPSQIIDESVLEHMRDDSLIVDLASKPGGVDFEAAKALNKKVVWALSLPGKVAPITAGEIIADTIENMLEEMGVSV